MAPKKFLAVLFLAGISVLESWLCPRAMAQTEKIPRGGTLKVAFSEPTTLNPAVGGGAPMGVAGMQIFAGLLLYDENFKPRPYLANSWEIAADECTYTFHLEKNATFHDGKPVTSADVAFSLEAVKRYHHFGPVMFRAVEKVENPDPHTVLVRLKHPYPSFMASLHPMFMPILPKHIYGEGEFRKHPANIKPVGSGPFKFVEWQKGRHIILERNDNFFRKGRPYLERIIIEFIPDSAARTVAMETGAIHLVPFSNIGGEDARRLEKAPRLDLTMKGYEAVGAKAWFAINVRKPPLNHLKVRKALAHVMDKDFIDKEIYLGFGRPAISPFHSSSPFFNPDVQRYEYSLDKANRFLDEAGYRRGTKGIRFNLAIDYFSARPETKALCEYMREQLKKVGIHCTLGVSPDWASYTAKAAEWNYEILFESVFDYPDPVIGIERMYISSNIKKLVWTNTMGYINPEVDRLFAEAQVEKEFETRKKLYHRAQEILVDELPIIWIEDFGFYSLFNKDYNGLPMDVWGVLNPYDTVYWRNGKAPH
jgi:peptide/nickel transport system substrate-binding protein